MSDLFPRTAVHRCRNCNGTGKVAVRVARYQRKGRGKIADIACSHCEGGATEVEFTLEERVDRIENYLQGLATLDEGASQ